MLTSLFTVVVLFYLILLEIGLILAMVDQASPWKNPMMKGLEAFKRKHGPLVVGTVAPLLMLWQSIMILLHKAAKHGLYDYQFYHTATVSILIAVLFYLFLLMADVHKTLNRIKASEEEDNNAILKATQRRIIIARKKTV